MEEKYDPALPYEGFSPADAESTAHASGPYAMTTNDHIAYPKAMKILNERWKATQEDLAAWIYLGPDLSGIAAYRNTNELNPPPRFYFEDSMGEDYLSPLMACWFRQDDLDRFEPADRYITGAALIERWSKQLGLQAEAFICAKIAESRLLDMHPIFGVTQAHFKDIIPPSLIEESIPPLSAGLFAMSEIKQIETEDGLDVPVLPGADAGPDSTPMAPKKSPEEMYAEMAAAGMDDKTIAKKIKATHPHITDAALGKLFCSPGENLAHTTYQSKARRLLDKKK